MPWAGLPKAPRPACGPEGIRGYHAPPGALRTDPAALPRTSALDFYKIGLNSRNSESRFPDQWSLAVTMGIWLKCADWIPPTGK